MAQADVVIVNGVGYDDFMDNLLGASGAHPRGRLGAAGARGERRRCQPPPLVRPPAGARSGRGHRAGAGRGSPGHKADFEANLATFERSLAPVQAVIATIRRSTRGAPVAYTERVPGYLLAAAGLTVKTPPGFASAVEEGNEPAPGDVQP